MERIKSSTDRPSWVPRPVVEARCQRSPNRSSPNDAQGHLPKKLISLKLSREEGCQFNKYCIPSYDFLLKLLVLKTSCFPAFAISMASSEQSLQRTIYVGTFIYCLSLTDLEILENAAIGVDENGIIAFIEKDVKEPGVAEVAEKKYGWKDSSIIKGVEDSTAFFFPGFVG